MHWRDTLQPSKSTRKPGLAAIELVVGLLLFTPILLVIIDMAIVVLSVQVNDSICREAARAAACGNPTDAHARALAVVNLAKTKSGAYVSNLKLVRVTSTVSAAALAALSPYGGPVVGSVTVQTSVEVKPIVLHWAYKGKWPLTFDSEQTFPYSYVVPNTAKINEPVDPNCACGIQAVALSLRHKHKEQHA